MGRKPVRVLLAVAVAAAGGIVALSGTAAAAPESA
jgi:hypothetical protein